MKILKRGNDKNIKILFLSTTGNECGIATYTTNLIESLPEGIEPHQYPLPNRADMINLDHHDIRDIFDKFVKECKKYDVIHIQHEHGLFYGNGDEADGISNFGRVLRQLVSMDKEVFVTFHSEPVFFRTWLDVIKRRDGFGPTVLMKLLSRLWKKKVAKWFTKKHCNINAIVHNDNSKQEFIKTGFEESNVHVIPHGVISRKTTFRKIDPDKDIINLTIFGFISGYKGYHTSIRALQYLPENYRLICLGGRHPNSSGYEYDDILNFAADRDREVTEHKLPLNLVYDRITITGYAEEQEADAWHKKTDICLAPYDDRTLSGSGALTWSLTSGRPVIACDIPSFKAINDKYKCMQMIAVQGNHELVWAIKKIVNDVALQRTLVQNAIKYCTDNSWREVGKHHLELYKR